MSWFERPPKLPKPKWLDINNGPNGNWLCNAANAFAMLAAASGGDGVCLKSWPCRKTKNTKTKLVQKLRDLG